MPRMKWLAKDIPTKCICIGGHRTQWTFEGIPGLVLDCLPNKKRVWRFRYRVWIAGKRVERAYTLGRLDPEGSRALGVIPQSTVLQPGQARDKALRIAVEASEGGDPCLGRRMERIHESVDTFGEVVRDWIERHSKPNKRSWLEDEKRFARHIVMPLGQIPVAELSRQHIVAIRDSIATNIGHVEANHVHALISAALKWAVNQGRIYSHPAYGLPKLKEHHRERYIRPDELQAIWCRLEKLPPRTADGIRLCLLLGQRSSEIAGITASELTLENDDPFWVLPSSRSKNKLAHLVPLPPLAITIIQRNISRAPFIFPGGSTPATVRPMTRETLSKSFTAVVRDLQIKDLVLHDARHTVKTGFAEMGVPVNISDRVTNQISGDRTRAGSRYEHYEFRSEKRRALELWERRLLEIVEGQATSHLRW